ncbi:glutamate carboxypeptidase II [Phlyctema vagabunda]|uniref:Glutamate carboxypeptidase II n=1 Tax=Phlyctema vagabunda TaxID=108571 RepID=A0ABR4PAK3_9HELO
MRISIETQEDVENVMLKTPEVAWIQHWSKLYSAEPHLAGDLAHAERIQDLWTRYGIPTKLVRYDVLQNIPLSTSLSLHSKDGKVKYQAKLTEPALASDPTSSPTNGYPAFHGFSANGNVRGELVYANFGRLADFQLLEEKGISVKGKIAICKYGNVFRGLKVRAAEQFGAAGVIIYSDPQGDGEFTAKNGYAYYPDGPARHPESIQRGSVEYFGSWAGDPTTPGYPSLPGDGTKREDPYKAIPTIPSLPISFSDAIPLLKALEGNGLKPSEIDAVGDWQGGLDEVHYFTGPSHETVHLVNEGEYIYNPIYNVIGTIEGSGDELVVLGNHHDSWSCGAVDPVSASASMNEMVRGFGKLLDLGWKPERTIILASWDGEEYGLLGSTEWGEENKQLLSKHCVAYLNVDESTNGGAILGALGSPLLSQVLRDVAHKVPSPHSKSRTIYDDWLNYYKETTKDGSLPGLGVIGTGSDYTVFQDHLGIPSIDMGFTSKNNNAVYPYHSNYDSHHWVEKFGDVGFCKHLAITQLWGVLAVRLASVEVLPFQASEYASELKKHLAQLKKDAGHKISLKSMEESIRQFTTATQRLDTQAQGFRDRIEVEYHIGSSGYRQIAAINRKYISVERAFLIKDGGLPGRPWFKHMIFAPGLWKGYDGVVFPGILEALELNELKKADEWVKRISDAISSLSVAL